jgi:hypothetical protein
VKEIERDLDKTEEIFRLSSLKQRSTECQSNGSPNVKIIIKLECIWIWNNKCGKSYRISSKTL